MMELRLDGGEVGEDVGVVEFEIVEYRGARPVVDELGALVEKGGVVFVGLDDEERAVGEPRGNAEIERHAADQEPRIQPGMIENPREHRRRRRLAVRAGDREHPLVVEHVLEEPLRSRLVGQPGVEDRLDERIAARQRVADDEDVRAARDARQLRGVVALGERDAERLELRAHRRIDVGVAAGHLESRRDWRWPRCRP